MSPINNNSATYKSLINESTTVTPLPLPFKYTGTSSASYTSTSCALPLNNKSTNDISLIYKSLMFISNTILLTFSLLGQGRVITTKRVITTQTNKSLLFIKLLIKLLIFFLLLCNQVEGTFISLIKLNLFPIPISRSNTSSTIMSISTNGSDMNACVLNPPLSAAQLAAAAGCLPPLGFTGIEI